MISIIVTAYNVASTIVRKAFTAFQNANSDFFTLIKAHVQWYLSNPGAEKLDENKATRTRVLNMNAGENVEKLSDKTEENIAKVLMRVSLAGFIRYFRLSVWQRLWACRTSVWAAGTYSVPAQKSPSWS